MKHKPSFLPVHKWRVPLLLLATLFFFQCANQDVEFLDPFEFVNNDFEDIGELPAVNDPEPTPSTVTPVEIVQSPRTAQIIGDVSTATEPEDVTEENLQTINDVAVATAALPPASAAALTTEAQNVDQARLDALVANPNAISPEVAAALTGLLANPEIAALFASLTPETAGTRMDTEAIRLLNSDDLISRIETLSGPCADAARASYNRALAELDAARDARLATIAANFTSREAAANTRAATRTADANDRATARVNDAVATFLALQTVANLPSFSALRNDLLLFAFVNLITTLQTSNAALAADIVRIEAGRTADLAAAAAARTAATNQVQTDYAASLAVLNQRLQAALNACHNQGSAN
ncbi:MAG: hypothetical protein ACXIT9_12560 [Nitritalea sp.]